MKFKTPDEIHKALSGQVVRLDPHPSNDAIRCMRCEPVVIDAMRSMPTAPQTWYSASDVAYLVKAHDTGRLTSGLRSFGAVVIGDAAPLNSPSAEVATSGAEPGDRPRRMTRESWPAWCGECDERTRQRDVPTPEGSLDHPTVMRCPVCHPLRAEPLPGMNGRRHVPTSEAADPEAHRAGVARVRAELDAIRARRAAERDEIPTLGDLIGQLPVEVIIEGEVLESELDEAHPF